MTKRESERERGHEAAAECVGGVGGGGGVGVGGGTGTDQAAAGAHIRARFATQQLFFRSTFSPSAREHVRSL